MAIRTPTPLVPVTPSPGQRMADPRPCLGSVGGVATAPDVVMEQAKRDIDAGLVDTDMRATPGLDAARRARLVPGAGGQPVVVSGRLKPRR